MPRTLALHKMPRLFAWSATLLALSSKSLGWVRWALLFGGSGVLCWDRCDAMSSGVSCQNDSFGIPTWAETLRLQLHRRMRGGGSGVLPTWEGKLPTCPNALAFIVAVWPLILT